MHKNVYIILIVHFASTGYYSFTCWFILCDQHKNHTGYNNPASPPDQSKEQKKSASWGQEKNKHKSSGARRMNGSTHEENKNNLEHMNRKIQKHTIQNTREKKKMPKLSPKYYWRDVILRVLGACIDRVETRERERLVDSTRALDSLPRWNSVTRQYLIAPCTLSALIRFVAYLR